MQPVVEALFEIGDRLNSPCPWIYSESYYHSLIGAVPLSAAFSSNLTGSITVYGRGGIVDKRP